MFLHVKVFPKSKREKIEEIKENYFHIYIKEKAEKNIANKRVREILSSQLQKEEQKIHLISGHQRPKKIFKIDK